MSGERAVHEEDMDVEPAAIEFQDVVENGLETCGSPVEQVPDGSVGG